MTDEERGTHEQERRAAVAEILARGLVRLLLQGHPSPKTPPPQLHRQSQPVEQKDLVTIAGSSRHVSVGNEPKTLPENELRCATSREGSKGAKPTKGATTC